MFSALIIVLLIIDTADKLALKALCLYDKKAIAGVLNVKGAQKMEQNPGNRMVDGPVLISNHIYLFLKREMMIKWF